MKTNISRAGLATLIATMAFPLSGWGLDIRIPHPKTVVREVRGAVHRVAREVEGAGRRATDAVSSNPQQRTPRKRDADPTAPPQTSPSATSPLPSPSGVVVSPAGSPSFAESLEPETSAAMESISAPQSSLKPSQAANAAIDRSTPSSAREAEPTITLKDLPNPTTAPSEKKARPHPAPSQPLPPNQSGAPGPSSENADVPFARPVPGKKGLVYPPGSAETLEHMVDVRDFASGTLVKNPRTGKLFRVP